MWQQSHCLAEIWPPGLTPLVKYLGYKRGCYFYLGLPQANPRRVLVAEDSDVLCLHFLLFIYFWIAAPRQPWYWGLTETGIAANGPLDYQWKVGCSNKYSIFMLAYFKLLPSAVKLEWMPAYCTVSHSGITVESMLHYSFNFSFSDLMWYKLLMLLPREIGSQDTSIPEADRAQPILLVCTSEGPHYNGEWIMHVCRQEGKHPFYY